jgi:DNA-binding MltR family transcriptional regulator
MRTSAQGFDLSKMKKFVEEANILTKELLEESDRGAALVGGVYLDELMKRLFEAKMLDKKALREKLLDYPGPLSTSAAQIDMAYSLGWIGSETYYDLTVVRKIRNTFAHGLKKKPITEKITFSHAAIKGLCESLKLPKSSQYQVEARDKFFFTISMLALRLDYYRSESRTTMSPQDPPVILLNPAELGESL